MKIQSQAQIHLQTSKEGTLWYISRGTATFTVTFTNRSWLVLLKTTIFSYLVEHYLHTTDIPKLPLSDVNNLQLGEKLSYHHVPTTTRATTVYRIFSLMITLEISCCKSDGVNKLLALQDLS